MRPLRRTRVAAFLAVRSLVRGNAGVSLMSIAMASAVFVSVTFLPSLLAGTMTALTGQLVTTLTGDLAIGSETGATLQNAGPYLAAVRDTRGVTAATGIRRVGTQISHGEESTTQGVDAIDPASYAAVFTTPEHLVEGEFLTPGDREGIVLGIGVAGADRTRLRSYSRSLKTVHAGDRVEVTLVGGGTHTFVVRGIYQNDFPLSDSAAFVTQAAADGLVSPTDLADQIRAGFAATDDLTAAVTQAADQAHALAAGAGTLSAATRRLAASGHALAATAATTGSGAAHLKGGASQVAASAAALAGAGSRLADGLDEAATTLAPPAVQAARAGATATTEVARDATTLSEQCPDDDPASSTYCSLMDRHAALAEAAAATAATSTAATEALASALTAASASAEQLAGQLADLSTATADLEDAATRLTTGTGGVSSAATDLAAAADQVASSAASVAGGASRLATALADGTHGSGGPDPSARDEILARLDSGSDPPGPDSFTRIVVRTEPGTDPADLERRLRALRDGVQFQTPAQIASVIQDQLDTFALIDAIMRVISLLVAAITVLVITYVDLANRRRQIGIERAIGIRPGAIVGSYVLKSAATALVGIVLGWLIFRFGIVPYVERHPFRFPNAAVTVELDRQTTRTNVVVLLLVAAVAAMLPAVRTVRMRILDAIWGA